MQKILGLLFLSLCMATAVPAAATVRGEKAAGVRAGYNTRNASAVAGIWFQYSFSSHFRLSPNADYVFRNDDTDGFSFNINAHFPIKTGSRFNVYPLAGLSYVSMTHHDKQPTEDVTTRTNKLGLNIGGGAEYYFTRSLKVYLEGKFNWVSHFNSGVFAAGIGFIF